MIFIPGRFLRRDQVPTHLTHILNTRCPRRAYFLPEHLRTELMAHDKGGLSDDDHRGPEDQSRGVVQWHASVEPVGGFYFCPYSEHIRCRA